MWTLSFEKKTLHRRCAVMSVLVSLSVLTAGGILSYQRHQRDYRVINGQELCIVIRSQDEARQAAVFFDASSANAPVQEEEVIIPYRFSDTYIRYNELQKAYGTNLEDYKGKTCTKYSFYQEDDSGSGGHTVTLLVCRKHLIGGDISENAFDGAMRGLVSFTA